MTNKQIENEYGDCAREQMLAYLTKVHELQKKAAGKMTVDVHLLNDHGAIFGGVVREPQISISITVMDVFGQENHRLDVEWTNRADDHDKDKILSFLKALKESDFFIEYIYTRGGCYQLYKVLKSLWPSAQPYLGVHMAHVITRIGDRYFDINGEVKIDGNFLPMTAEEEQEVATWSFAGNNELYLGHCPVCDEPITIDRNKLIKPKEDKQ